MTDNEIIKALECCISHEGFEACKSSCPFHEQEMCLEDGDALLKCSLALIKRQQADVEQWKTLAHEAKDKVELLEIEKSAMQHRIDK